MFAKELGPIKRGHESLLLAGAREGYAFQMLYRALSGGGGFLRRDGVRYVACKVNVLLFGLVRQREVSVAWNAVVHLDKVGAGRLDFVYCAARPGDCG